MAKTITIIFLGVILAGSFCIVPLIMTANQNEKIMTSDVQSLLQEFANQCAKEGKITPERVEEIETKLSATDVQWKLELAVGVLDDNPGEKGAYSDAIGENLEVIYSDSQIREKLDNNEAFPIGKGGVIEAKAENITETDATKLKNSMYKVLGKDIPEKVVTATALCTVNP